MTKELVINLRLNADVKVIKESIDKKNLFFNIRLMHVSSSTSFEDLRFLIFDMIAPLKKVIIYDDSIELLIRIKETLIRFYKEAEDNLNRASRIIRCYNEKMSESEKKRIYENFRELNPDIRILCASDAMGLSMNIVDVDVIVQ